MLEDMNKKLQTIAEVQSSFQGQLGRSKDREGRTLSDRLEVIELAVKDTSLVLLAVCFGRVYATKNE